MIAAWAEAAFFPIKAERLVTAAHHHELTVLHNEALHKTHSRVKRVELIFKNLPGVFLSYIYWYTHILHSEKKKITTSVSLSHFSYVRTY